MIELIKLYWFSCIVIPAGSRVFCGKNAKITMINARNWIDFGTSHGKTP